MPTIRAIALCRVSSREQEDNLSLGRQNERVRKCAKELGVELPDNYVWSGVVSSRKGKNLKRKDIQQMLECCKHDRTIKYLIIDEPDRFMRSMKEALYFQVEFDKLGVEIHYTDPSLNGDDAITGFMRVMKYFAAEGSNDERIKKSIDGQGTAIKDGKCPCNIHAGYKKGAIKGIHEIDPEFGPYLKIALERIADGTATILEAMKELNATCPVILNGKHRPYESYTWKPVIANPYYAGIIEVKGKHSQHRNEHGLHAPLITKEQHYRILERINNKKKIHSGPKKGGNPRFPFNTLLICEKCHSKYEISNHKGEYKYTGCDNKNGHSDKVYSRYLCRGCNHAINRDAMHNKIKSFVTNFDFTEEGKRLLKTKLRQVWRQEEADNEREGRLLIQQAQTLKQANDALLEAIIDPENKDIKQDLKEKFDKQKVEFETIMTKVKDLSSNNETHWNDFLNFALDFADNLANHILELTPNETRKCKEIIFPSGFWLNEKDEFYTKEISPLYRYRTLKNSTKYTPKTKNGAVDWG